MVNNVLPAIRAKLSREDVNKPIFIKDNAPSHFKFDDPVFVRPQSKKGLIFASFVNHPILRILTF
jgi:hypothetical protein